MNATKTPEQSAHDAFLRELLGVAIKDAAHHALDRWIEEHRVKTTDKRTGHHYLTVDGDELLVSVEISRVKR